MRMSLLCFLWIIVILFSTFYGGATTQAESSLVEIELNKGAWVTLNIFFSNFSECELPFFHKDQLPDDELIAFGIRHNIINNPELIQKIDRKRYDERISAAQVRKSISKYFGEKAIRHRTIQAYSVEWGNQSKTGFFLYEKGYYLIPRDMDFQIDPARFPGGETEKFSQIEKLRYDQLNDLYIADLNIYAIYGEDTDFQGDKYREKPKRWAERTTWRIVLSFI